MNKKTNNLLMLILLLTLSACGSSNFTSESLNKSESTSLTDNSSSISNHYNSSSSVDYSSNNGENYSSNSSDDYSFSENNSSSYDDINHDFRGISMNDKTITYDGNYHTIEVNGLPDFANVEYENNGPYINVGSYTINAIITANNYNTLYLSAKLSIIKANIEGLMFESKSFEYDGTSKTISVSGNIPADASITYTSDVSGISNVATEIGIYNIEALIKSSNYNDLTLKAKLTITANDDKRYIRTNGNILYFQNALDNDKFYAYNFTDSSINKISNDKAIEMQPLNDKSLLYISKSLVSSLNTVSYDESTKKYTSNLLLTKNASYIQVENDTTIYFANNGLSNDKSGIYKVDFSGQDPIITCLSIGKAKYLQLHENKIYFADGANGDKLSSILINQENQSRTLVVDEKINNLSLVDGVLYFTVNNLLGDYIAKYTINTKIFRKLTIDAGIDFVVYNEELYYVNVDKFTSSIIGKGIYKVNINPLVDNNNIGSKVIDGKDLGVCSLSSYEDNLIYYDVNGYQLIKYSLDSKKSVNLLDGFVKPDDPVPTSFGSQVEEANGIIYYLDIYDEKTLHSYNPKTNSNYRLTSQKVMNFSIIGDYIYYNMVSYGVNNDMYRINIKNNSEPELINTNDGDDIISDGKYIYYVYKNATGAASAIHKANLDGSNDIEIFKYAADNLVLNNGTLYFCAKPNLVQTIMKIENVANVTTLQDKVCVNKDYACDVFTIKNNTIYFRHNHGLGYKYHKLAKMNIDGSNYEVIVGEDTDPIEILVEDDYIYYANSADLKTDYNLYKISISGSSNSPIKLTTNMYVSSICKYENEIYFINYYLGGTLGDSYLYSVSLLNNQIKQISNK